MDNTPEIISEVTPVLSYDDTVAYEEQLPTEAERDSLAKRIGTSKVYLLSESSTAARVGKRKHDEEDDGMGEDTEMNEDFSYRPNAILLTGPPISELTTARIFAYATHFDSPPMGLEWVDDNTCVLVFTSRKAAVSAFAKLQKTASEEPDMDEMVAAKPFPVVLWPPEKVINSTLGTDQGLKGPIRMRWARPDDVKKKGAKQQSQFYRLHGPSAGKEIVNGRDLPQTKRRRRDDITNEEERRAQLDRELDEFLAEDDDETPSGETVEELGIPDSPPSKMRSDYISNDGRTLLERTSTKREPRSDGRPDFASRLSAPIPRRRRQRYKGGGLNYDDITNEFSDHTESTNRVDWGRDEYGRDNSGRRTRRGKERPPKTSTARPRKTQEELDAELDAFRLSNS